MQTEANAGAGTEASCERKEPIGVRQASKMKTSLNIKFQKNIFIKKFFD